MLPHGGVPGEIDAFARLPPAGRFMILILSAMLPSVPYYSLCPKESPGIRDLTNSSSSLIVFSTSVEHRDIAF